MTYHIDALYDSGVLKPLEPLILPDQSRVKVTVESAETNAATPDVLVKQQAALDEARRAVKAMQQHQNSDGWSVVDHDKLLYGGKS
jgi:predicted DNA-binding antitoxin AbrB/MazE fold protein